jgi:hypothetical protein
MVLYAVFVANHLTVQLIHQLVDCRVEIFVGTLRKDVISLHMDAALRSLPSLFLFLVFYREEHFDIDHLIKMSFDSI